MQYLNTSVPLTVNSFSWISFSVNYRESVGDRVSGSFSIPPPSSNFETDIRFYFTSLWYFLQFDSPKLINIEKKNNIDIQNENEMKKL